MLETPRLRASPNCEETSDFLGLASQAITCRRVATESRPGVRFLPKMPDTNSITLITVRIALVCYAIEVGLLLAGCRGPRWRILLRPLWTIGCLAIVAHVIAAFHYSHRWSHDDAIRSTAKQTEQLVGWAFGAGLYFNYLFLLIWIADVLYWWLRPERCESRPVWLEYGIHGYLFFIAVNGAVIFESGVTRIPGVLAIVIFAAILVRRRLKHR